jgi:hypothetical protein
LDNSNSRRIYSYLSGKKKIIDLFKKEDKTHEENIAVLEMLRKEISLDFDSNKIKFLTKKSIASLSFSIIQHQRKYNEKKKRAIELFFLVVQC